MDIIMDQIHTVLKDHYCGGRRSGKTFTWMYLIAGLSVSTYKDIMVTLDDRRIGMVQNNYLRILYDILIKFYREKEIKVVKSQRKIVINGYQTITFVLDEPNKFEGYDFRKVIII